MKPATGIPAASGGFRILAVCTGNICRSPAAERLLARALAPAVHVSSAGTAALEGHSIDDLTADLLVRDGLDASGFAGRQLTEPMARDSDLVLTMTREHRTDVVRAAPAAVRRTFTLVEFAEITSLPHVALLSAGTTLGAGLAAIVSAAARARAQVRPLVTADDVVDPHGGTSTEHARAYEQIRTAVETIASNLGGRR